MKRRLFALFLMLCLVLSCIGCSKEEPKTEPPKEGPKLSVKVNDHELTNVMLNYYYVDAIHEYVNQYGNYLQWFGIDPNKPLDDQVYEKESGKTWADYFLDNATNSAKITYALYDAAAKVNHSLTKVESDALVQLLDNIESFAKANGFQSADDYLISVYGNNASFESYVDYYEILLTASSYYSAYAQRLYDSYTEEALRQFEGDETYKYNSYSYANVYLERKNFDSDDALTQAAQSLAIADNNSVEKLNAAVETMEKTQNPDKTTFTTASIAKDQLYSKINSEMQEWVRDSQRKDGDITFLKRVTKATDASGKEVETLTGYYIVLFQGVNDNQYPLANVRHILAKFEGGTTNVTTGQKVYTDAEKKKEKEEAEKIYTEWLNGAKTEESFAELAKKYTDDGNGDVGGLYENVFPGQMVTTFNDWCFGDRKSGDHGIVETEFGYHIMYYSGDSKTTYRDYMVKGEKQSADVEAWMKALTEVTTLQIIDTDCINKDYIISPSQTKA